MVAIVGFYFGTRALETALEETPKLAIHPSDSIELFKDETLHIKAETTPNDELIVWKIDGDPKGKLFQTTQNEFEYTPSNERVKGDRVYLTFVLAKHSNKRASLEVIIKEKTESPTTVSKTTKGQVA